MCQSCYTINACIKKKYYRYQTSKGKNFWEKNIQRNNKQHLYKTKKPYKHKAKAMDSNT